MKGLCGSRYILFRNQDRHVYLECSFNTECLVFDRFEHVLLETSRFTLGVPLKHRHSVAEAVGTEVQGGSDLTGTICV